MKKTIAVIVIAAVCFSAFAGNVLLKDIGFSFGQANFLFDKHDPSGVGMLLGGTFGLTERLELDVQALTMLTPKLCGDFSVGIELGYSLLGERVFDYDNAGLGINMLVSVGLFANDHNPDGRFLPTILTLRITPLTVGSPRTGRRERLLPMGIAWNFYSNEFTFFFSAFIFDFYDKDRVAGEE